MLPLCALRWPNHVFWVLFFCFFCCFTAIRDKLGTKIRSYAKLTLVWKELLTRKSQNIIVLHYDKPVLVWNSGSLAMAVQCFFAASNVKISAMCIRSKTRTILNFIIVLLFSVKNIDKIEQRRLFGFYRENYQ